MSQTRRVASGSRITVNVRACVCELAASGACTQHDVGGACRQSCSNWATFCELLGRWSTVWETHSQSKWRTPQAMCATAPLWSLSESSRAHCRCGAWRLLPAMPCTFCCSCVVGELVALIGVCVLEPVLYLQHLRSHCFQVQPHSFRWVLSTATSVAAACCAELRTLWM